MKNLLLYALRFYRNFISPFFLPTCRFYPTCSQYALEAIETYGALKGGWTALKRLSKCQPYHPGGYDPLTELEKSPNSGLVNSTMNQHNYSL